MSREQLQVVLLNFHNLFMLLRWVCTSGLEEDLQESDKIAADVLQSLKGEGKNIKYFLLYEAHLMPVSAGLMHCKKS